MDVVIKMSDMHVPYQDNTAINTALSLVKHIQPMILVLDEVLDFYTLSKYNKDPARIIDLQKDLDKSFEILYNIRKAVPNTRIVMVESNHDKRLMKYKFSKAPELSYLRNLTFEKLMRLAEVDIEYKPFFIFRNILFKHGNIVRQDSGYTAKAEYTKEGMNGASGHSHRLSMFFKTLRGGKYVWLESGCLCKTTNVEYIDGTADWQQGLVMFMFKDGKKHFQPKVIPIIKGEILWGSKLFKGGK